MSCQIKKTSIWQLGTSFPKYENDGLQASHIISSANMSIWTEEPFKNHELSMTALKSSGKTCVLTRGSQWISWRAQWGRRWPALRASTGQDLAGLGEDKVHSLDLTRDPKGKQIRKDEEREAKLLVCSEAAEALPGWACRRQWRHCEFCAGVWGVGGRE